ncbi:VOC family protein [Herpetosiphon llansteffanensis]
MTTTIPALPCADLDQTIDFWRNLGFEVSYTQRKPAPYAVINAHDYCLHFFGLKHLPPAENYSTCLIIVAEVEQLHQQFAERLKASLGKVPAQGIPRISRMKQGQSRFTLTDNAGNSIIFIKHGDEDESAAQAYLNPDQSPLQRALAVAARLRDFKNDDQAAAKTLDNALARYTDEPVFEYAQALLARLELAQALEQSDQVERLNMQLSNLALNQEQRQQLGL